MSLFQDVLYLLKDALFLPRPHGHPHPSTRELGWDFPLCPPSWGNSIRRNACQPRKREQS